MQRDPLPETPPGRPYPVADVTAYLTGRWEVERTVCDLRAGLEGRFHGTADFRAESGAPGQEFVLLHVEEGHLVWNGRERPASRSLRMRSRTDGTALVEFADGRPFHDLDLRTGTWTALHPCAPDRYEGTFTALSADAWHLEWRVAGPAKDQSLRSVYRRR